MNTKAIETICNSIDYNGLRKIMKSIGWKYDDHIPSVSELRRFAESTCRDAVRENSNASCGGWSASYDDRSDLLVLEFNLIERMIDGHGELSGDGMMVKNLNVPVED